MNKQIHTNAYTPKKMQTNIIAENVCHIIFLPLLFRLLFVAFSDILFTSSEPEYVSCSEKKTQKKTQKHYFVIV